MSSYASFTRLADCCYPDGFMELTREHAGKLEKLHARGFEIVAFPMYASYVGLRKGLCAALVEPLATGGFRLFGQASVLIGGNFSVRVRKDGREWFVWKQERVEATAERLAELVAFSDELAQELTGKQ